ncbi:MAG: CoA protein activase, partial [Desulfobacteraceae bacterium]|nr:CoA protein activase [Desulfobacteraceae bacterium]
DIPIISVTASQGLIDQPGFKINWLMKIKILLVTTMYADCIAKMYYATAPREKTTGQSQKLREHYIQTACKSVGKNDYSKIFKLLEQAVDAFNDVGIHKKEFPKMGIVGEIYAKYNYFANQNLVHWLIKKGIEPVLPPIVDYFIQDLVNYRENIKAGIRHPKFTDLLGLPIEWLVNAYHKKINTLFSKFKYASPFDEIKQVAQNASKILTMTNQFGEGWLIPGEIATFAEQDINHVVSLQPFGCVANHIVSKGVETRIKSVYPDMNIHHLDFDAGMSEANVRNRLHFMIEHL